MACYVGMLLFVNLSLGLLNIRQTAKRWLLLFGSLESSLLLHGQYSQRQFFQVSNIFSLDCWFSEQVNYLTFHGKKLEQSAWCSIPFTEESVASLYMMAASTIVYFIFPLFFVATMYVRWGNHLSWDNFLWVKEFVRMCLHLQNSSLGSSSSGCTARCSDHQCQASRYFLKLLVFGFMPQW